MSVETNLRDITDGITEGVDQKHIAAAVANIIESRSVIEQAKGMLMFVYGINAEAAFELLRWQSQQHNVKVRNLAEQIVEDLTEQHKVTPPAQRLTYDTVILTAHARAGGPPRTAA